MMRFKIFIILAVFFFLCSKNIYSQKEIFLKLIEFRLDEVSEQDYENEYFMTIKFNKGSTYKIKVTNHLDNYAGQAVFEMFDADKRILTNLVEEEKYYDVFSFVCSKTGFYDILIRFKDNKLGNSVVEIKLLQ